MEIFDRENHEMLVPEGTSRPSQGALPTGILSYLQHFGDRSGNIHLHSRPWFLLMIVVLVP